MAMDAWDIALVLLTGAGALFTAGAAVATAFAARGAFKAADVALDIANQQAQRDEVQSARRADVHAAFVCMQVMVINGFAADLQGLASGAGASTNGAVLQNLTSQMAAVSLRLEQAIDRVRPDNIAELPSEFAAQTAAGISDARYTAHLAQAAHEFAKTGNVEQQNKAINIARGVETHCFKIQRKFAQYISYAKEHFDADY